MVHQNTEVFDFTVIDVTRGKKKNLCKKCISQIFRLNFKISKYVGKDNT